MGGVKDKYLKTENAGDQYVGRCDSCLDQLDKSFAVLPPHFHFGNVDDIESVIMKAKLKDWLKYRILQYDSVPACTRVLIDFLFASVYYNFTYLNENLHIESRFRASALFRNIPQEIIDCATIAYPWNITRYTPKITGVPPHVLLINKMKELLQKFEGIRGDIKDDVGGMLDSRGVGGSEFHTNQILEAIRDISTNR